MKYLLLIVSALALATSGFAQSNANIDRAIAILLQGTGRAPNSLGGPPATVPLSSGVIGLDGNLTLGTDTSGRMIVPNRTNNFHFLLSFPDPTANRTISFPIGGGTMVTTPTTLAWQFTGATYNTVLTQTEPTGSSTVITLPDTAGTNVAIVYSTLTTNSLSAANSVWMSSNGLNFEGATADSFETTISAVDPTADQTWSIPNFAVNAAFVGSTLTTNNVDAANSAWFTSNNLVFEGATADSFETFITVTDPTADRTITLPNASGTVRVAQASTAVSLTADDQVVTPGQANVIQLSSDNATATNRTFTLSATGAITGAIYIIIGPATNGCEIADTGIQKLSATWTPTTTDTLTLLFDGTSFIELARAANH